MQLALKDTDSIRPIAVDTGSRSVFSRRRSSFAPWQMAAAALCGGAALLGSFAWWNGRYGELVVDIADQECGSLESVRVYVDEELRCTTAPCTLRVRTGGHLVRAEVDGFTPAAARAVFVDADMPALHKIQTGVSDRTAIEVRGGAREGQLYIDGNLEGLLPKRVTGLTRGEHSVVIRDTKGSLVLERTVFLEEEQLLVLDLAVPAPEQETRATESPEPSDAKPVSELPRSRSERAPQDEDDGSPSRSNDVVLAAASPKSTPVESESSRATTKRPESSAQGTFRLTAEPSAMVLMDGRPLGQTPQRVRVDPGVHTILFVHPEHGRSRVTAKVQAGQIRNLHARF